MKKSILALLLVVVMLSLAACAGTTEPEDQPGGQSSEESEGRVVENWRIGTSSIGGNFYTMGSAAAQMLTEKCGQKAASQATNGAIENCFLLEDDEIDIGMLQSTTMYDAVNGLGAFDGEKMENLRHVANFYISAYHVVVRKDAGIKSLEELRGKNVAVGPMGGGIESNTNFLLRQYGLEPEDYKSMYSTAAEMWEMMKDGQVDLIMLGTGKGASQVEDALSTGYGELLSQDMEKVEEIVAENTHYNVEIIPPNTYSNQPEEVVTISGTAMFCADPRTSEESIYFFLENLYEHNEYLQTFNQAYRDCTIENGVKSATAPLHPGAEKFFREHDVIQ